MPTAEKLHFEAGFKKLYIYLHTNLQ